MDFDIAGIDPGLLAWDVVRAAGPLTDAQNWTQNCLKHWLRGHLHERSMIFLDRYKILIISRRLSKVKIDYERENCENCDFQFLRPPTLWRILTVRVESYWCRFFCFIVKAALLIIWFGQTSGNFQLTIKLSKNFVKIKINQSEINTIAILFRNNHSTFRFFLSKIWVIQRSAFANRVTRMTL